MKKSLKTSILLTGLGITLSGCTSLSPQMAFEDVAMTVEERTGVRINWDQNTEEDRQAREAVARMLKRPLTIKSATQIALLNNRSLQAAYTDLGIAQAQLVQAGLLKNPTFDFAAITPDAVGSTANLTYGFVFQFIDALYIPLRKRVAASQLEEAKLKVASFVIDHAALTQTAYIDYIAARQLTQLFRQVEKSARASLEAAKALRKAGNSTQLDFETQQRMLSEAKLGLAAAQMAKAEARERMNQAMGLSGKQTYWKARGRLKGLPRRIVRFRKFEVKALEKSLDLAAGRQRLLTLAKMYRVDTATSIIPDLEIGYEIERDGAERDWARGPNFSVIVPIFDQGRAKRMKARMMIRREQELYWNLAVNVRSQARLVMARLKMARGKVAFYQKALLPQTSKILNATQREYNAMQLGVFRLLAAKRDQISTGQKYVQALQAYWQARIAYEQLMRGRLPVGGGMAMAALDAGPSAAPGGH